MELENFDDLQLNPKNPRKISEQQFEALKQSIARFGDLGAIIRNQRSGHLVGGHMRKRAFENLSGQKRIVITHRYDTPTRQGTVAIGYVEYDNEMHPYRLVDWDEGTEKAAMVAANKIGGVWDEDLLSQVNYELSQLENGDELLALTGQSEDEITKLLQSVGAEASIEQEQSQGQQKQDDGMQRPKFKFTEEQYDVVYQAIGMMKRERQLTNEPNSDLDANALYYICRSYAETATSHNIEQASDTPSQTTETPQPDLTGIPADTAA
jgi:hypothetical protein